MGRSDRGGLVRLFVCLLLACGGTLRRDSSAIRTRTPVPDASWVGPDGIAIPDWIQAATADRTRIPEAHLGWRTGFSVAQTGVVGLADVDASVLPSWRAADPTTGTVRLLDRATGVFLPCFAELDAHPDARDPQLLVRPLSALPIGSDVAVVVTTAAAPVQSRSTRSSAGGCAAPTSSDKPSTAPSSTRSWLLGWPRTSSRSRGRSRSSDGTAPLRAALAAVDPPGAQVFDRVRGADDDVVPGTHRAAEGTFTVQDFLGESGTLHFESGVPVPVGEREADLYVHVPALRRGRSCRHGAGAAVRSWHLPRA